MVHGFIVFSSLPRKHPPPPPLTRALLSFPSRLRHDQEGAFPPQSFHRELPVGGDRALPAQEEAAHPELADPAQQERAVRGREGPSHQDSAEEMQLPQEPGVSTRTCTNPQKLSQWELSKTSTHPKLLSSPFYQKRPGCAFVRGVLRFKSL